MHHPDNKSNTTTSKQASTLLCTELSTENQLSESLIIVNRAELTLPLATSLSQILGVTLQHADNLNPPCIDYPYQLIVDATCSYLLRYNGHQFERLDCDFTSPSFLTRLQTSGRKHPLAKSLGLHKNKHLQPTVYDLTAGLGRDGVTMAYLGCQVHLIEKSPLIAHLLFNALERAQQHPTLGPVINSRLSWQQNHGEIVLKQLSPQNYPDVIYLDPMFPKRNKSAKVKLAMQILQDLLPHTDEQDQLLELALSKCHKRVVVKRPKNAPYLAGVKPHHSIASPGLRFDVYLVTVA